MEVFVPSTITAYGYFHTALSIGSMVAGIWAFMDAGRICGERRSGKIFYAVTLIGIITGLTIFHHGGFGPGHVLSVLMLGLLAAAWFASLKAKWLIEIVSSSFLYFLIWFFATSETFTRFPQDHPFASSPTDLALVPVRGILLLILAGGIFLQYRAAKRR